MKEIKKAYQILVKALGFECLGCAKCEHLDNSTSKILLTKEEVEKIRRNGKLYGVVPYDKIYGITGYLKLKPNKNECIFLDKKNRCKIHDYKPLICYLHPFQLFTTGFVFGGGIVFDTKCSWVKKKKNRKKLDEPSKEVHNAYSQLYKVIWKYKIKYLTKTKINE